MARILVCDDSAFMRMMLKRQLTEDGHEIVGEAGDGKQAIEMYFKVRPDITTMDITMPGLDGIQAVKHIHEEDPLAKIIMVTALGQRAIITDALKAGASDFIIKPFEPEQVRVTINKILAELKK
ncbi:response regulator [Propionispora vibrioides]|uniref:Two-component system, chemotaxis family, response regulator CheY n=1 Tax=Propionispora vibrioides TaxID=112903 RepID=A0A1H8X1M8_9FIRM|nr:response regulator [Propionispora vibrioides]SEP33766.1 two-component system, chemotaxis family, response regulator CheY [Propionispora vibrioides]